MAEEVSGAGERRYERIAKQIEREDDLFIKRLNLCLLINLALSTAAGSQVKVIRVDPFAPWLFYASVIAGIVVTSTINSYMWSGKRQIDYLKAEFRDLQTSTSEPLIAPFYQDCSKRRRLIPYSWSRIPFLLLLMWIVASIGAPVLVVTLG